MKPNNARLSVVFRFCINELLTHLHRTAAKNIVFVFTNVRSTNYEPGWCMLIHSTIYVCSKSTILGETYPLLENLLEENNIPIILNEKTVFCMDNEAFRYLAASKKSILLGQDHLYSESWKRAR